MGRELIRNKQIRTVESCKIGRNRKGRNDKMGKTIEVYTSLNGVKALYTGGGDVSVGHVKLPPSLTEKIEIDEARVISKREENVNIVRIDAEKVNGKTGKPYNDTFTGFKLGSL